MSITVLFVDDEPLILRSIKRDFSCEFDLSVAYSAAEAQALLGGVRQFDVVVTDVRMPGMNGLDFIELVAPRNPDSAFVVLTGNCDAETHERANALPAVARVLTKPASREEILDAIRHAAVSRHCEPSA